jgi:mannosyltransferase
VIGSARLGRWWQLAIVVVLLAAVALRFLAASPLWLDEAQSVDIANRSLPHLFTALRHDGSPPLYYLLLHWWIDAFGTSSVAVRSLSGVAAVLSIPVAGLVARTWRARVGSPWPFMLLVATSPFAVRYATETRMYALELLLVLLALLCFERLWAVGGWRWGVAATVVTAALVLTHYWALFAVATAGLPAVIVAARGSKPARRCLAALSVGCLALVPWLPSFLFQMRHTGAPWGTPPGLDTPVSSPFAWAGVGPAAAVLALAYYALAVLAMAGERGAGGGITLRLPLRRRPTLLFALAGATLLVGTVVSDVLGSSYASRYSMIVLAPFLLALTGGFAALPPRQRLISLAVVTALGLGASAPLPTRYRTQAGEVAKVVAAAQPDDLVVFCPDQLGPGVHRLLPHTGRQVVFPTFGSPQMVDWVDYVKRNSAADPVAFARRALAMAGPQHAVWLVWAPGYPTFADDCEQLVTAFAVARGEPLTSALTHGNSIERDRVAVFLPR